MLVAAGVGRREARADPVEIHRGFRGGKTGADTCGFFHKYSMRLVADDTVGGGGQVDAANMAVTVVAEIGDVVTARQLQTERGGALDEAVGIVETIIAVVVEDDRRLRGETGPGEILTIDIGEQDIVVPRRFGDVVQPGIEILLEPTEVGKIVLPAIVVAVAKQADAGLRILEQEAAEVGRKRLDANAQAIEVVARIHIAKMLVDPQFLHAEKAVVAIFAQPRIDLQRPRLLRIDAVVVERKRGLVLDLWWLERGITLVIVRAGDEVLHESGLVDMAQRIQLAAAAGALRADGQRRALCLDESVGDETQCQEMILAIDRLVALEHILIVRIGQRKLEAERFHDAPAVRHRQEGARLIDRRWRDAVRILHGEFRQWLVGVSGTAPWNLRFGWIVGRCRQNAEKFEHAWCCDRYLLRGNVGICGQGSNCRNPDTGTNDARAKFGAHITCPRRHWRRWYPGTAPADIVRNADASPAAPAGLRALPAVRC